MRKELNTSTSTFKTIIEKGGMLETKRSRKNVSIILPSGLLKMPKHLE